MGKTVSLGIAEVVLKEKTQRKWKSKQLIFNSCLFVQWCWSSFCLWDGNKERFREKCEAKHGYYLIPPSEFETRSNSSCLHRQNPPSPGYVGPDKCGVTHAGLADAHWPALVNTLCGLFLGVIFPGYLQDALFRKKTARLMVSENFIHCLYEETETQRGSTACSPVTKPRPK